MESRILNSVLNEALTAQVTFGQRPEGVREQPRLPLVEECSKKTGNNKFLRGNMPGKEQQEVLVVLGVEYCSNSL